jgi:fermentation-respiration switch protein FrsA (DUF1100 family)
MFGCATLLGCRNKITQSLVFFPPEPQYAFSDDMETIYSIDEAGNLKFPLTSSENIRVSLHFIDVKRSHRIAGMYLKNISPTAHFTLLYSHGNATDIGHMREHVWNLALDLDCSVFIYDYAGYGLSSGHCTVSNVEADVLAAFRFMADTLAIPERQIVLYGQSLGTGASCFLASRASSRDIAGVILHAPLMSGLRVVKPVQRTLFFDIFPNIDWIRRVAQPVFIIHGTSDLEIPVDHGRMIYEASNQLYAPWFVEGGGHNDIELRWREEWIDRVGAYLRHVRDGAHK